MRGVGGRTRGSVVAGAGEQRGEGRGPDSVVARVVWNVWSAESRTP